MPPRLPAAGTGHHLPASRRPDSSGWMRAACEKGTFVARADLRSIHHPRSADGKDVELHVA